MDAERKRLFDVYQKAKECPGKRHYLRFLKGEILTLKQSVIADCFICTAGYLDGKIDCENDLCVLHRYMPYRKDKQKSVKVRSIKQQEHSLKLSLSHSGSNKKHALQEF